MKLTAKQIAAIARESRKIVPNCAQELGVYADGSCEISVGPHGYYLGREQITPVLRIKHAVTAATVREMVDVRVGRR
jgi:hypothetical protein